MTNWGKNENEGEKVWENIFNFWIFHIKMRICGNFHENWRKKFLTDFLRHFWLTEAKIKMKTKKLAKMISIFDFSIWKLGYMELFIKMWEKKCFCFPNFTWKGHTMTEVLKRVNDELFIILSILRGQFCNFWDMPFSTYKAFGSFFKEQGFYFCLKKSL